jgi:hypothetical protein
MPHVWTVLDPMRSVDIAEVGRSSRPEPTSKSGQRGEHDWGCENGARTEDCRARYGFAAHDRKVDAPTQRVELAKSLPEVGHLPDPPITSV